MSAYYKAGSVLGDLHKLLHLNFPALQDQAVFIEI